MFSKLKEALMILFASKIMDIYVTELKLKNYSLKGKTITILNETAYTYILHIAIILNKRIKLQIFYIGA